MASTRVTASHQLRTGLANTVRREAFVISCNDGFFLVGVALAAMVELVWFCRPVKGGGAATH